MGRLTKESPFFLISFDASEGGEGRSQGIFRPQDVLAKSTEKRKSDCIVLGLCNVRFRMLCPGHVYPWPENGVINQGVFIIVG